VPVSTVGRWQQLLQRAAVPKDFSPLVPGFRYVPYNDIEAVETAITGN